MTLINLNVDGLAELERRIGTGAASLDTELKAAIRKSGEVVRDDAKHLAVGNKLPNSVQMTALSGGLTAIVGSTAKTALSIEEGRKKGEMPSVGLITAWMGRKGITAQVQGARVSLTTRRVLGTKGQAIGKAQRALAWKIAMAIRDHGTKPLPFIVPAAKDKFASVQQLINDAVGRALHKMAKG